MKKFLLLCAVIALSVSISSSAFADTVIDTPAASSTNSAPVTFTGTGVENTTIELLEDGNQIATAEVDGSGDWSLTTSNVTLGEHDYVARNVLNAPLAVVLPHNGPSVEFKNMNDFGGEMVITLPDAGMVARAAVVRGSKFWVLASGADPADGCYVYAYESNYFSLENTYDMGGPCVGVSLDVDDAGAFAAVGETVPSTSQMFVGILNLNTSSVTAHIEPSDSFNGGLQDTKISPDGDTVYVRYSQKLVSYDTDMVSTGEFDFAGSYGGNIEVSRNGSYVYLPLGDTLHKRNANDITSSSNADPIAGATLNNVAVSPDGDTVLAIGVNGGPIMYEFDATTLGVTHTTPFGQYPESVSITPDSLRYAVGDNHSSGFIYYGSLGTDAYTTTTSEAGASYYNQNSSFITNDDPHFITQSPAVTMTIVAGPTVVTFGNDTSNPITSATRAPGQTLDVSGKNFAPNSEVTIYLYSSPVLLTTLTTSALGTFSTTVTIPVGTALGNHQIVVSGTDGNNNPVTGTLNLLVAQSPATVGQLPATGSNPISHFWLAFNLILIGAVLVGGTVLVRRRVGLLIKSN